MTLSDTVIATITTQAGDSRYAKAAQDYAFALSQALGARLRIIALWGEDTVPKDIDAEQVAEEAAQNIVEKAKAAGIVVVESGRGDKDGLLEEARMSDLFVVGMPTDQDLTEDDEMATRIQERERPLLHEAECSVLVVSKPPPRPIANVLVNYQGGIEGKSALRVAGELGIGCLSKVTVLSIHGDIGQASVMGQTAEEYLSVFNVAQLNVLEKEGPSDSWVDIKEVAKECQADLVILGEDPYGLLDRFLSRNIGERMAEATDLPVLLAR